MKEKLIELFKKTCNDFEIHKEDEFIKLNISSIPAETIKSWFPKEYLTIFKKYPFKRERVKNDYFGRGFEFKQNPPIIISSAYATYEVIYGHSFPILSYFFPILSYFFFNNYKRRKRIKEQISELIKYSTGDFSKLKVDTMIYKKIEFTYTKYFIIHGSIVEELSNLEYNNLMKEFKNSVIEYDENILDKRLRKK